MSVSREEVLRHLMSQLTPVREAATVVGMANGVLQVQVASQTQLIEYTGTDLLPPGSNVWVRKIPGHPHGAYEYVSGRLQRGDVGGYGGVHSQQQVDPAAASLVIAAATSSVDLSGVEAEIASVASDLSDLDDRVSTLEDEIAAGLGGHTITDGTGGAYPQRKNLMFLGATLTITDDAGTDTTIVSIDGTMPVFSHILYDAHVLYDSHIEWGG